jgi:hypothetical protein
VGGAVDQHLALEPGHGVPELRHRHLASRRADQAILCARDEQGRLADRYILPRREQRPVAIDVAIIVEATRKAGAPERRD